MNSNHVTNLSVGVVGTVASVSLSDWSSIATIVAGFGTGVYMLSAAVLKWLQHFRNDCPTK